MIMEMTIKTPMRYLAPIRKAIIKRQKIINIGKDVGRRGLLYFELVGTHIFRGITESSMEIPQKLKNRTRMYPAISLCIPSKENEL